MYWRVPRTTQTALTTPITPEIQALAAKLDHQPVNIYNWVYNNIAFISTYGAVQGPQLTLELKQGNAFDTSSLLVALLRASNIEAQYILGTVNIPMFPISS